MARTVRNPLELRTPVRTISSVMRNAPRQQFSPTQLGAVNDFGNRRGFDNNRDVTSVIRQPRETIAGGAPVSQGAPIARVQTGANRAPQSMAKPAITSAIKNPAVAKPVIDKAPLRPTATKIPAVTKTPTKKPVVAKTPVTPKTTKPITKTPIAAKTTPTKLTTPKKPVTPTGLPITKPVTKPTNTVTSTLKKAAVGAGTAALINSLVNKKTTPTTSISNKPTNLPTMGGGQGLKVGTNNAGIKTNTTKNTPVSKTATAGTTTALTDEQIQAELDRVKAEQEANTVPEGAVTNADGSYSVTENGMTTTYGADGSIIGMEAADTTTGTDTTLTTGADTSTMTDLGEGYFADADGNVYGADGNLMYTVGADGEYVDANATGTTTAEETTYTDPDTGLTWNLGKDGNWTQEGFDGSDDGTTVVDDTVVDDGTNDDELGYLTTADDGTNYEELDAKGGSIPSKRHFETGGYAGAGYGEDDGYSDTGEEVQPFQNVDYNYGEFDNPKMFAGDTSPYAGSMAKNTYLRSASFPSPEGFPDGYVDNGDGTATYVDDDGSTITIDADNNIVFTTDSDGNVFNVGDQNSRLPVNSITSSGSGIKPNFAKLDEERKAGQNQPNQTGILDSLLNAVKENPGLAGGAVGALIASLMDQAGGDSSTRQPVDMSELYSMAPRTTDFGAGMVGGRTGTGSPLVSYADYAGDNGDEIIDDRLFSDLGVSGYLREPDMADYRDEDGNLTDQSGNLVDEYGYLLDDGNYEEEVPEEENAVEDAGEEEPTMASGGTTHYTFGRVMNPADNLGLSQGMKQGGLSQAHTVHSHHTNPVIENRVDFRKGSAVNGAGDGQSDDIPAWLADGEYVMDAELVSMLGNGSNKAGAKVLDKFREDIRAHKRSAPLGKIPPKAKSPLNYLKESMNG